MVDVIALHHTHIHIRAARWAVEDLADPHGDDPHGDDPNYRYIAQQSATAVVDAVKVHTNPTLCVLIFGTRFEMPRDRVFLPSSPLATKRALSSPVLRHAIYHLSRADSNI